MNHRLPEANGELLEDCQMYQSFVVSYFTQSPLNQMLDLASHSCMHLVRLKTHLDGMNIFVMYLKSCLGNAQFFLKLGHSDVEAYTNVDYRQPY